MRNWIVLVQEHVKTITITWYLKFHLAKWIEKCYKCLIPWIAWNIATTILYHCCRRIALYEPNVYEHSVTKGTHRNSSPDNIHSEFYGPHDGGQTLTNSAYKQRCEQNFALFEISIVPKGIQTLCSVIGSHLRSPTTKLHPLCHIVGLAIVTANWSRTPLNELPKYQFNESSEWFSTRAACSNNVLAILNQCGNENMSNMEGFKWHLNFHPPILNCSNFLNVRSHNSLPATQRQFCIIDLAETWICANRLSTVHENYIPNSIHLGWPRAVK